MPKLVCVEGGVVGVCCATCMCVHMVAMCNVLKTVMVTGGIQNPRGYQLDLASVF